MDISSITRKARNEQGDSSQASSQTSLLCKNDDQNFNSPSFALESQHWEDEKESENIEITFNGKESNALFDIQKTQLEILESHRRETRRLQQRQNKLHFENNKLAEKLKKSKPSENQSNIWKLKRKVKELKTARELRTHSFGNESAALW